MMRLSQILKNRCVWSQMVALLLGAWLCLPSWSHAQFRVEVTGIGATQIPLAMAPFRAEESAPQPVSAIVRANLERVGAFKVHTLGAGADEQTQPVWANLRSIPVDAVVLGSVTRLADGRFDVRFRLWDVLKGQELLARTLVVSPQDLRWAAHRISDDVYAKLTGESGAFSSRIAYVSKTGRRYELKVADSDGEGAQTALSSAEPIISPTWSPEGNELAYVSFESGKPVVYAQDVRSGKRRTMANFRGSNSAPAWQPQGQGLIVTLTREGGSQLYWLPRGESEARRLTRTQGIDTEASFAPDGKTFYFVSDRGGSPQIYRGHLDAGTAAERVTFQGQYNISPAISPDGRRMAYISRIGSAFRLHVMDLSSGQVVAVTDTQDDESPSFAANGRWLIYATRTGGRDVLMMSTLDGSVKARLSASGADVFEPTWGPVRPAP